MDKWPDRIREQRGTLAALALALVAGACWLQGRPVTQPPGELVPEDPVQVEPERPRVWTFRDHRMTELARFEIRARVLSTERYRFDRPARLSPVDFALGWGPMSDSAVLQRVSIQQRDRWYFWHSATLPISPAAITAHSANMHMIPSTDLVERQLLRVKEGQVVEIKGRLVRADGDDGWHWVSSLSREDSGDGSCEVVWVDSIRAADH